MSHFNGLSAEEAEALALLAEECGEVVQAVGKILRYGWESRHPNGGKTNRAALEMELSHVLVAQGILADVLNSISLFNVSFYQANKRRCVGAYLHHIVLDSGEERPEPQ